MSGWVLYLSKQHFSAWSPRGLADVLILTVDQEYISNQLQSKDHTLKKVLDNMLLSQL